jgi:hypothetical protein
VSEPKVEDRHRERARAFMDNPNSDILTRTDLAVLIAEVEAEATERGAMLGRGAKEIDHLALDSMSRMLADARVLLKDAMLAGAMLNETLNPLFDWEPRDKANRRKQWQAAEDEIGKFLAPAPTETTTEPTEETRP